MSKKKSNDLNKVLRRTLLLRAEKLEKKIKRLKHLEAEYRAIKRLLESSELLDEEENLPF